MGIEGFDNDNHLTNEVNRGLADDGKITQEEAIFMMDIINKYGRKNIKIKHKELVDLGKEFGLNYSNILKIGPKLEGEIKKRAFNINTEKVRKTTKSSLGILLNDLGFNNLVGSKIEKNKNKYLNGRGELNNVNSITLKKLISFDDKNINALIGNTNNFSIRNKNGKIYNVFLGRKPNGKTDYYYKDGPNKNQRVKIYDGDKLGLFNNSSEELRNEGDIKFTKRIIRHNNIMDKIENHDFDNLYTLGGDYGKLYRKKNSKLKNIDFPDQFEDIKEAFADVDISVFKKKYPNFDTNKLKELNNKFNSIKKYASLGYERLVKNLSIKGKKLTKNNPITVYVPNKDRAISLSFTYNPISGKIEIRPFGYSYKGFSNNLDSKQTPVGTFKIGKSKKTKNIYENSSLGTSKSPKGAAMDTIGLEIKLNDNTGASQLRGAYTHGSDKGRSEKLTTGKGTTSWGCRVFSAIDSREVYDIYKTQRQKGYSGYEEVLPTIKT